MKPTSDMGEKVHNLNKIWEAKTDEDLIAAAHNLADFTPEGQVAVLKELKRRGFQLSSQELASSIQKKLAPQKKKSIVFAVLLSFFFGPFGMLYVHRFWRSAGVMLLFFLSAVAVYASQKPSYVVDNIRIFFALVYFLVGLVVLPIWAALRARELNQDISKKSFVDHQVPKTVSSESSAWTCPRCQKANRGDLYTCQHCGYSLV
jgi:hypothetical protein